MVGFLCTPVMLSGAVRIATRSSLRSRSIPTLTPAPSTGTTPQPSPSLWIAALQKPDLLPPGEYERFTNLVDHLMRVPRKEMLSREAEYRKKRTRIQTNPALCAEQKENELRSA
jgi:hypothetical protein